MVEVSKSTVEVLMQFQVLDLGRNEKTLSTLESMVSELEYTNILMNLDISFREKLNGRTGGSLRGGID